MVDINVQTTVSERLYELLAATARREKRSLKSVVREAIESYLGRKSPPEKDPLMEFVGGGRLKETDWSVRKDWRA